jgi:hypothetical protein
MKYMMYLSSFVVCLMLVTQPVTAQEKAANKFVGVKICAPCHKTEKSGNQFAVWQKSKHSEAFKALVSDKANEIAKAKGLTKPAAESPECLQCHTLTADAKMVEKTFDPKDGVQCEVCHGAGSAYKSISVMKDKAKAIAAGLSEYKDDASIEKKCRTCHNEKSPTYKEFKFEERWPKIKHATPKKS